MQRVLRAAGASTRARAAARCRSRLGISLTPAGDTARQVRADAAAGRLRTGRCRGDAAAHGARRRGHRRGRRPARSRLWTRCRAASRPAGPFVDPDAARLLARYMRDAVLTAPDAACAATRRRSPARPARRKSPASASHSWFVGFAPYGPAAKADRVRGHRRERRLRRRAAAAPAAGEIVSAAAAAGRDPMNNYGLLEQGPRPRGELAGTLDRTVGEFVRSGAREPLEIVHAIVDTAQAEIQPGGRGRGCFRSTASTVTVLAPSRDARARFEADSRWRAVAARPHRRAPCRPPAARRRSRRHARVRQRAPASTGGRRNSTSSSTASPTRAPGAEAGRCTASRRADGRSQAPPSGALTRSRLDAHRHGPLRRRPRQPPPADPDQSRGVHRRLERVNQSVSRRHAHIGYEPAARGVSAVRRWQRARHRRRAPRADPAVPRARAACVSSPATRSCSATHACA